MDFTTITYIQFGILVHPNVLAMIWCTNLFYAIFSNKSPAQLSYHTLYG
jgi:hypothetical protein